MPYGPATWVAASPSNYPPLPDNVAGATGAFCLFNGRAWFGMGGATGDDGEYFPRLLENGWGSIHSCRSNLSDWRLHFTFAGQHGYTSWVPRALGVTTLPNGDEMIHCLAAVFRRAYFTVSEPSLIARGAMAIWSSYDGDNWFLNETVHEWPLIAGGLGIGTANTQRHDGFFFSGKRVNNGADRHFVVFQSHQSATGPGAFSESHIKRAVYKTDDGGVTWQQHIDLDVHPFAGDGSGAVFNAVANVTRSNQQPERLIIALSSASGGPWDDISGSTVLYSDDGMETLHHAATEEIGIGGGAQQIIDHVLVFADKGLWGSRSAGTGAVTRSGGSCNQKDFTWDSEPTLVPQVGTGFSFGMAQTVSLREAVYSGVDSAGDRELFYTSDGGETWTYQGNTLTNLGFPGVTPGLVKMPNGRLVAYRINPIQFGLGMSNTFVRCTQDAPGVNSPRNNCPLLSAGLARAEFVDCGPVLVPIICEGALLGD